LLERIDPAVPKLRLIIERVQNGWRVALTDTAVDADRCRPAIGESACRIVACGAGDCAVTLEPALEEQLLAQRDLSGRERAGRRHDRCSQGRGKADLILRPRPRQGARLRQRRRLSRRQRGWWTDAGVLTHSRCGDNRAKAHRKNRGEGGQNCRYPSIGRHLAVVLIVFGLFRSLANPQREQLNISPNSGVADFPQNTV
jgi:hypothetical protein